MEDVSSGYKDKDNDVATLLEYKGFIIHACAGLVQGLVRPTHPQGSYCIHVIINLIIFKMASRDEEYSYHDEWGQIERELTCSICSELFREPKTLPCLHTFCKECIQASLDTTERVTGQKTCPLCRSPLPRDGIASIPTNFTTNRLIEIFNSRRTSDNNVNSSQLCPQVSLIAEPQYCSEHNDQPLELYCITCSQLICAKCTYIDHPHSKHQLEHFRKVIISKQAKIKEISAPLQSLMDRVQVAVKNNEASKRAVNSRCSDSNEKVCSFFKDLHKALEDQKDKVLQNVDAIRLRSHKSLDSQRKGLLSLQKQLSSCKGSALRMSRSNNIDELSAHINWVDSRVTDLTSSVGHANFDPACKGDSIVCCADRRVFTSHCESLCHVSTPPHPPLCSVKSPTDHMLQSTTNPVVIAVTLKDAFDFPVTNQPQCLKISPSNPKDSFYDVKVEEHTCGLYHISYHPKERKDHSVSVTWNDIILNGEEVNVSFCVRDYTVIQKPILVIDTHRASHIINGPNNELIVCDVFYHQAVVFTDNLQYSHVIIGANAESGLPNGIAVDSSGQFLYVAFFETNCIRKFNMDGSFITQFGISGSDEGQFNSPGGLVVSKKTGQLYVCDNNNDRIQVFLNEHFEFSFGRSGCEPGALQQPNSMALNNAETQLFVADTNNNRIQVFTPNGEFVCVLGKYTDIPYKLDLPYSIYCTPDDHLLVTSFTNVVLIFKSDGTFLAAIEGRGRFENPTGVVMRNNGEIVISGYNNKKLVIF